MAPRKVSAEVGPPPGRPAPGREPPGYAMLLGMPKGRKLLIPVVALLICAAAVVTWNLRKASPAPVTEVPKTATRASGRAAPKFARRRVIQPRKTTKAADRARAFQGQPGWLVVGRSSRGEDGAMWEARKLESRGIEATAIRGDLFTELDADTIYVVYGGYRSPGEADKKSAALKAQGVSSRVLQSGPVRLLPGDETDPPKRLTAIRGIVTDDGEPAAYHVERRMEGTGEEEGQLDALMPDAAGHFFFWTNRRGVMTLAISLPLELDELKDSGEGASVEIEDTGPAILDVVLEVESKAPATAP